MPAEPSANAPLQSSTVANGPSTTSTSLKRRSMSLSAVRDGSASAAAALADKTASKRIAITDREQESHKDEHLPSLDEGYEQ